MNRPPIKQDAQDYVVAKGYIDHNQQVAARAAYMTAFNMGAREGWARCGVYYIDFDFESRTLTEAKQRWPGIDVTFEEYLLDKGYLNEDVRGAAKDAFLVGRKIGARQGWLHCGSVHFSYFMNSDGSIKSREQTEIDNRWPL